VKRVLIIVGVCAVLGIGLVAIEIYRQARLAMSTAKSDHAAAMAFLAFVNALNAQDYTRMHAEMAPSFRAAVSESELAARFQAFHQKHGAGNGYNMSHSSGFAWSVKNGLDFKPKYLYRLSFKNTKDVPFDFDVELEGDKGRITRIALRTPTDPIELPAPSTTTAPPAAAPASASAAK
jgi:hypothetical protein